MVVDIMKAFIQTPLDRNDNKDVIIMKIFGELVDILIGSNLNMYKGYVGYKRRNKVIYVEVLRAICRILISAIL